MTDVKPNSYSLLLKIKPTPKIDVGFTIGSLPLK
jgi:hypothetical protein